MNRLSLILLLYLMGLFAECQDKTLIFRVLFLGNSYTAVNNLPQLIAAVASSAEFSGVALCGGLSTSMEAEASATPFWA